MRALTSRGQRANWWDGLSLEATARYPCFDWWLAGDEALSPRARDAIKDEGNSVAVRAASAMEVVTKFRMGKLPDAALIAQDFEAIIADQGFADLPITVLHALRAGEMNIAHKDPFDRLLIAQASSKDMVLISKEASTASPSNACGSELPTR